MSLDPERLARAMSASLDIYGWDLDEMAATIAAEYEALSPPALDDHDINCGIDALRLGEDIGCTCHVRLELPR